MKNKFLFLYIILTVTLNSTGWASKTSSPFSQAKFVPNISLIMDLSYNFRSINDQKYLNMNIPGLNDTYGSVERGFNFNYLELAFSAVVDPFFDFFTTLHISHGEVEMEEGYIKTRSLPAGFKIKAGQFLSGFGRLNSQHGHIWNFTDQPLIYSSLFGEENLNELGLQLTWVAPVNFYLAFGAEILQGTNKILFGNESFTILTNEFNKSEKPLYISHIKTSFDLDEFIVLMGASFGSGRHQSYREEYDYAFSGDSILYGFDLTLKYLIDSYRYLTFQTEYIGSKSEGIEYQISTGDEMVFLGNLSGFYSELIYRYSMRWRAGVRYDLIGRRSEHIFEKNNVDKAGVKYSAMIEFNPSEFSRIRLQFIHDRSRFYFEENKAFNEVFININVAVGAHGAHKF